ncbi:MAG: hypothetical protein J6P58_03645, partial [Oscillospiraceae bacterium]|nr:hypothetical protein [Oscillospiraceae bacterium]
MYYYEKESNSGYFYTYNVVYLNPGDTITVENHASDGMMQVCYAEFKMDPSLTNVMVYDFSLDNWSSHPKMVDLSKSYTYEVETSEYHDHAYRRFLHSDGTWSMGNPDRMPNPQSDSYDKTYFLPDKISFTFPESASKDSYYMLSVYSGFELCYEGTDDEEYGYYSNDFVIRLIGDKTPTPAADPPAPKVDPPAPEVIPPKPKVAPTNQKLTVDGVAKNTEIYNIDGSNYFKLRDIAALLNGTDAQFSVEYDPDIKMIDICIGEPYESVGGELTVGTDKSASAVPSSQQIRVNYASVDLTAYNIGGNNFFKLRDLGDALNFDVDYDSATRTILINTVYSPAWDQLKSLGKVQIEDGAGYAYITLPKDYVIEGITQEQIDAGAGESYTAAKLNQDGSLTYKLNKAQHKALLDSVAETIENALREVTDNPDYGIGNIFCYDDYSLFSVYLATDEIGFNEEYLDMA